ncbi:autophagy-related protein 13 homolog [Culicoides brevitarsis]|uniref:autophagy-related protein 13 homolog n=1 Tax=Culicoides brevitarsis TaxID=469753 RepID=UPI00307C3DA8
MKKNQNTHKNRIISFYAFSKPDELIKLQQSNLRVIMSSKLNAMEIKEIDKFVKFLVLKSTQVIVQSRLGSQIRTEANSSKNDWFNINIFDQPDVLSETRKALQISSSDSVIPRLPLCVEISLQTVEGDKMILEVWSLGMQTDLADPTLKATYAIYNRMGILLKSLISVTRVTPAYKLSRRQSPDSFHIYYRIYCGQPQEHNLGDGYKQVRVGQLAVPLGTITISVAYRTKMTITPTQTVGNNSVTMKGPDPQWNIDDLSPKHKNNRKASKVIDIDRPMKIGAFVDVSSAKTFTEADFSLPETPQFSWLMRKQQLSATATSNSSTNSQKDCDDPLAGTSPVSLNEFKRTSSRWSTRTLPGEDEKLFKEPHYPFATQDTPISDLAKFYRECFNAPPLHQFAEQEEQNESPRLSESSNAEETMEDTLGANSPGATTTNVERNNSINDLTKQLEQFETSLGDYDSLLTSLCQKNTEVDDNLNS